MVSGEGWGEVVVSGQWSGGVFEAWGQFLRALLLQWSPWERERDAERIDNDLITNNVISSSGQKEAGCER